MRSSLVTLRANQMCVDARAGRRLLSSELIVNSRGSNTSRRSSSRTSLWSRLLVAVGFAFYVNFIPIHLATKTHLDSALASVAHDDSDPAHVDTDHHVPHPASDHILTLTTETPSFSVDCVAFFLPADTLVLICQPELRPPLPVFERIRPPGESPPDPRQPRAPPLA